MVPPAGSFLPERTKTHSHSHSRSHPRSRPRSSRRHPVRRRSSAILLLGVVLWSLLVVVRQSWTAPCYDTRYRCSYHCDRHFDAGTVSDGAGKSSDKKESSDDTNDTNDTNDETLSMLHNNNNNNNNKKDKAKNNQTRHTTKPRNNEAFLRVFNPWDRTRYVVCGSTKQQGQEPSVVPIRPNRTVLLRIVGEDWDAALLSVALHNNSSSNIINNNNNNNNKTATQIDGGPEFNTTLSVVCANSDLLAALESPPELGPEPHTDAGRAEERSSTGSALWPHTRFFDADPADPKHTTTATTPKPAMPAVTLRFGYEVDEPLLTNHYHQLSDQQCNVPCVQWGKMYTYKNFATVEGTPFRFRAVSMEGSGYYSGLDVGRFREAHRSQEFFATTSFRSEVPLTYYSLDAADADGLADGGNGGGAPANDPRKFPTVGFDQGIKGASFLARNCGSINHREDLVRDLIREMETRNHASNHSDGTITAAAAAAANAANRSSFRLDSLSDCVPHAPHGFPGNTSGTSPKSDILRHYLFHLAFENQNVDDYITEKLWQTLEEGTIPVYWGASNVRDHLPHPNSVVVVRDFSLDREKDDPTKHNINVTALADHLWKVAHNRTLYESYHAWKKKDGAAPQSRHDERTSSTGTGNDRGLQHELDDAIAGASETRNEDENENDYYYSRFLDKYAFTKTDFVCRMCRFVYAMQHGWGWDHGRQQARGLLPPSNFYETSKHPGKPSSAAVWGTSGSVMHPFSSEETAYNRSTCFSFVDDHHGAGNNDEDGTHKNHNRMVYPMRETWSSDLAADGHGPIRDKSPEPGAFVRCTVPAHNHRRVVSPSGARFVRTVWDHDGVTDMVLAPETLPNPSFPAAPQRKGSSSHLLSLQTPFREARELLLVGPRRWNHNEGSSGPHHTSYCVESEWRNLDWKRFATASNKKARKRILPRRSSSSSSSGEDPWNERGGTLAWIQNEKSRIVLMADWPDAFSGAVVGSTTDGATASNETHKDGAASHGDGGSGNATTVRLGVPGDVSVVLPPPPLPLEETDPRLGKRYRLRWIVEDLDAFHGGSLEKESYFSSVMVDDFFRPLTARRVVGR